MPFHQQWPELTFCAFPLCAPHIKGVDPDCAITTPYSRWFAVDIGVQQRSSHRTPTRYGLAMGHVAR